MHSWIGRKGALERKVMPYMGLFKADEHWDGEANHGAKSGHQVDERPISDYKTFRPRGDSASSTWPRIP